MKRTEKIAIGALVVALVISFSLLGVWEDKVTFYAPLLALVYVATALWVVASYRSRDVGAYRSNDAAVNLHTPSSPHTHTPLLPYIQTPPGGVWLLLFLLYSAAMIPFAVLPYEAKIGTLRFGCYLITYWAAANILSRFSYRKAVWLTVFSALVFVALYSLVQHKVAPNLIFGIERYTHYWENGRLGGTYQCPNHIAHLYQMWIPLCLVFLFIPQFGWFWRICFAYAIPLFLLLIYQTQSRAGLLGTVAAVGTTVLFVILRKSRRAFYIALLVVPLLGAVAVGGLWAGSFMFRTRMQPVVKFLKYHMHEDAVEDQFKDFRPQTWLDTIEMIKHRPVFGFGPGNYGATYEDYRTRFKGVRVETVHAHNEYLEMTAEYGLIGAALVAGVLISIFVRLIGFIRTSPRPYHALPAAALLGALAGTMVHGFFDFELRNFPNAMMLALLAGCAVAPLLQLQRGKTGRGKEILTTAGARGSQSGSEDRKL